MALGKLLFSAQVNVPYRRRDQKDEDQDFQLNISEEDTFSRLQASSVTYRFATGPSKGKKAFALKSVPGGDHNAKSGLVVKNSGFSLHAAVATKAHEREKLVALVPRPRGLRVHENIKFILKEALKFWQKNDKAKALFLIGHATHTIQDSFSPAHTVRTIDRGISRIGIIF